MVKDIAYKIIWSLVECDTTSVVYIKLYNLRWNIIAYIQLYGLGWNIIWRAVNDTTMREEEEDRWNIIWRAVIN